MCIRDSNKEKHPTAIQSTSPTLSPSLSLGVVVALLFAVAPGHQLYKRYDNYLEYPDGFNVLIVAHVIFGIVMQLCGAMQFWPWLRKEHRMVHRCIGGVYLLGLCLLLVSASVMLPMQIQSKYEKGHFGLKGWYYNVGLFICALLSGVLAYGHILRGNWVKHRCWMLRNYAVLSSVSFFDIVQWVCIGAPQSQILGGGDGSGNGDQSVRLSFGWLTLVVFLLAADAVIDWNDWATPPHHIHEIHE
eukprot:TRINITY_DN46225_c0_g1_i1.p2 TRINITY_DN46225_c0_g1~~TRINITY_DN46225_c0_g1_i1.p2  ORF type:complete len:245 (+),score=44.58 TRINITY_DN46225_c0_g1_i1:95-829(+)